MVVSIIGPPGVELLLRHLILEQLKRVAPKKNQGKTIGADGDRTRNLRIANAALSQLSYGPSSTVYRTRKVQQGWKLREG
jgi:hypothetical protein